MNMNRRFHIPFVAGIGVCLLSMISLAQENAAAKRPAWTQSRVVGTPDVPEPYRIAPAFPHLRFQKPTSIEEIPEADRLMVTEMGGKIFTFSKNPDIRQTDLLIDLREQLSTDLAGKDVSLFDAEFHPKFREHRYLYVCYVHPGQGGHTRVSRFTITSDQSPRAVAGSEQVIITWPAGGHNAGCLEFGKDGYLYIATGDGSGPNPPDGRTTGQDVSDLLGAILRIDVDKPGEEKQYTVPPDNPFVELQGARPEIWAYGLRNPWKFGIDAESGDIFVADNGWESWEMVHRIVRGGNCGWPVMEGRVALRDEVKVGPTPIIPPVKDHPHTEANSVIGGPVYRGQKLPGLVGSFVYGDYITGTIWGIRPERDGAYSCTTLVDTDLRIVGFTSGSKGEVFVLDYDFTGQIYELLPNNQPDRSVSFPRRLSETGLFATTKILKPAPGVMPYQVQVDRWMDGAAAQRWIAIPGAGRVQLSATREKPAEFPEGTVLVKHLTLPQDGRPPIPLETQLLHYENGVWHPYSYLWDDAGDDARLVDSIGANRTLQVRNPAGKGELIERTWHVNATNECKLCHEAGARYVLGFTANQLHRPVSGFASKTVDQLTILTSLGVIGSSPSLADDDPARLVDPFDAAQKLDDRARSYLHANCSMCHHPGGNAIVSFYLRRELPFEKLNTNKGTGIGTFGMHNAKIIVPGDPYRSVMMYRMSKLGYARMPYIGSQVVDGAGVALIEQWIRSLPHESQQEDSAPITSGSVEARALRTLGSNEPAEREKRDGVIRDLLKSTEGSLALIARLHERKLPADVVQAAVAQGSKIATRDIRGLFETFLPESQRRKTLGANVNPQGILELHGDQQRGKLIFFSDGARCRACHHIEDRNQSLGPTLQEINKKYARPAELLQHVLQPSLKVDDPFAAFLITTDDGRVLNGLVVEQSAQEVVIKTAEKHVVRVPRKSIEEMRKSTKSLMPEGVLSDLTPQEAADLFEYLRTQAGAK